MFKGVRTFRTFRNREDGLAGIEFALLAVPFFTMLMGIIEISFFFAAGNMLEGATADAARMIRTGQAQLSADPEAAFRDELCDKLNDFLNCNDVQYEVIRVEPNTFAGADDYEPEFDEDGDLVPGAFNSGNSNDVILVRAFYKYEFMTPFIENIMIDGENDWVTHMSTAVIKAEPYNFGEE